MPLTFNTLLADAGLAPTDVRLLRHETQRHGRTPYSLWRDDPALFDDYQRVQKRSRRGYFASPFWASFVVAPGGKTLFAGLAAARPCGAIPSNWVDPLSGRDAASLADYELYRLNRIDALDEYVGRVVVAWDKKKSRQWAQRADRQNKQIVELWDRFVEPSFPGYDRFVEQLSDIEALPADWRGALAAAKGVYLLTCPRTFEQYVGSACGGRGFFGRWLDYARDTHGGNVALKSRDPSDYRVTILQVAGSADLEETIFAMESLWKVKLQSREMGLNRN